MFSHHLVGYNTINCWNISMSRAYIEICVLPFSLRLLAMALSSDDVLRQRAAWTAKHMRATDWVARHYRWDQLVKNKPKRVCKMIAAHFGPDELLEGTATGSEPADIVVLKGRCKRQAKTENFFAKRPRPE